MSWTDELGTVHKLTYESHGWVASSTATLSSSTAGPVTEFMYAYDDAGNVLSEQYADGSKAKVKPDQRGEAAQVVGGLDNTDETPAAPSE